MRHTHRRRARKSEAQTPSLADFERKLTETDAYLQVIIKQVKDIDDEIDAATSNDERQKLVDIKAKTLTLLDGIKHTIVLLQIAKVSSCFVFLICSF